MGVSLILPLLRQLVDVSAEERASSADGVCEWLQSFSESEAAVIAQVLMWLAVNESDDVAKESQLHALAELAESERVPAAVLAQVSMIRTGDLSRSSSEHWDYLRSLTPNS